MDANGDSTKYLHSYYREYAHTGHSNWLKGHLKINLSPLGAKVANLLGYVGGGLYNCPIDLKKINWASNRAIEVVWKNNHLTNWDDFTLSRLWICCHREMLRVEISVGEYEETPDNMDDDEYADPVKYHALLLSFSQRQTRTGGTMDRIPDCEEMIGIVDSDFSRNGSQDKNPCGTYHNGG